MEWISLIGQWFANGWAGFSEMFYKNLIYDDRWVYMLKGLGVTVQITFFAIILGTFLGVIFCLLKLSKHKFLRGIAHVYIDTIRGTPMVIQLLIIYFGVFGSTAVPKTLVAIIAFGINSGAYVAEILRGGILSVSNGQMEAGRSLGLSYWQTMFAIVFPQAIKNALPTYTSEFIVLLKETAIVGYVALEDLTKVADYIRSRTWSAFFPLIVAALIYLAMTTVLTKLFGILERRLRQSDHR